MIKKPIHNYMIYDERGGACIWQNRELSMGIFDQLLSTIEDGIINGSVSASLEDSSDFRSKDARCSVRNFLTLTTIPSSNRVKSQYLHFSKWRGACSPFRQLRQVEAGLFSNQYFWGRGHFLINSD